MAKSQLDKIISRLNDICKPIIFSIEEKYYSVLFYSNYDNKKTLIFVTSGYSNAYRRIADYMVFLTQSKILERLKAVNNERFGNI